MFFKRLSILPLCFLLIHLSAADEVHFRQCPAIYDLADERLVPRNCTVHRVRIDPCPQAAQNKPCSIMRRQRATIAFDYTPENPATDLESMAFWTADEADIPFGGMETSACGYTTCNGTSGQEYSYSFSLEIPNKARPRQYDVKWKLWNDKLECCFIVTFVVPNRRH